MRWYHLSRGLTLVLLLTMLSLPGLSAAQGVGALTDSQGKGSAEDLARALFPEPGRTGTDPRCGTGAVAFGDGLTETGSDAQCTVRAEFSHGSAGVVRRG